MTEATEEDYPPLETIKLKPGDWLGGIYHVADVAGGVATLLVQSQYHTREQINEHGKKLRASRVRSEVNGKRLARKRIDKRPASRDDEARN